MGTLVPIHGGSEEEEKGNGTQIHSLPMTREPSIYEKQMVLYGCPWFNEKTTVIEIKVTSLVMR